MENNSKKIITEKSKIMDTVKKFKEGSTLRSYVITEKSLRIIEKSAKFHEDLANDENENENDVDYLIDCVVYFENLFHSFAVKYNIDYTPEKPIINDSGNALHSTFIETPEWIKNKLCTINPQNNGNNQLFKFAALLFS